jgi:hypothetical protein
MEEARLIVVDLNLDVLTYAPKDLPLMHAVSNLVIPALVDQLYSLKKIILPHLLVEHPQLRIYHFNPPGVLHPITSMYELNYGETEMKQGNNCSYVRRLCWVDNSICKIQNF